MKYVKQIETFNKYKLDTNYDHQLDPDKIHNFPTTQHDTYDGVTIIETEKGFKFGVDRMYIEEFGDFKIELPTGEIYDTRRLDA